MSKKLAILGSTGSIGTQSLQVAKTAGFDVTVLAAGSNAELLARQVQEYTPAVVAIADEAAAERFTKLISLPQGTVLLTGADSARLAIQQQPVDMVLNAIVGIAGLGATLTALQNGMDVALANKESLVTGGKLVMDAASRQGAALLPVDSEHSAIFQCLQDPHSAKTLQRILLTASGGPFYGKSREELQNMRSADALRHPNWDMGPKITIDSASLMNKGLELIEAMWLFDLPPQDIHIVVQRESIIHSMVEFADRSILAQLGVPDMRIPIQYALTYPRRVAGPAPRLDFDTLHSLSFGRPDAETFRCLAACQKAAAKGGLAPCAANGANEAAVALFLRDEISFLDIGRLVEACVDADSYSGAYTIQDVYACDAGARKFVRENI